MYLSVVGGHAIFLDARQRRYVALDATALGARGGALRGWPVSDASIGALESEDEGALESLVHRGLLTRDGTAGKDVTPVFVEPTRQILVEYDERVSCQIGPRLAFRFIIANVLALRSVRAGSLQRLAERNRMRRSHAPPQAMPITLDRARELVSAYQRLRPLVPPVRFPDLFDSIALTTFLSWYGVFPRIVIGVKTMPFETHTWVQEDGWVFNDTPEFVRRYTPIMVI
ncbi:MAG: lasso peptide biosynthesis B2 protein [Gammaproteobacteria bacterium]